MDKAKTKLTDIVGSLRYELAASSFRGPGMRHASGSRREDTSSA
jgi:hypothetical protein